MSKEQLNEQLFEAVKKEDIQQINSLMEQRADFNAEDENQKAPLHYAATKGHTAVAELLIVKGANVNAEDERGWSPLHYAAQESHKAMAELLLKNRANANAKCNIFFTPLHYAAIQGHTAMAKLLILMERMLMLKIYWEQRLFIMQLKKDIQQLQSY